MSLKEEISSAIQKNLPAAVAGELKDYLEEAKNNEKQVEELGKKVRRLENELNETKNFLSEANRKLQEHEEMDRRVISVTQRENALAVTIAEEKQRSAESKAGCIYDLAAIVFRNPVVRRTVFESAHMNPVYDNNAGRHTLEPNGNKDITETVEEN